MGRIKTARSSIGLSDFQDGIDLDTCAERKARDADRRSCVAARIGKNGDQEIGSTVMTFGWSLNPALEAT